MASYRDQVRAVGGEPPVQQLREWIGQGTAELLGLSS